MDSNSESNKLHEPLSTFNSDGQFFKTLAHCSVQ